MPNECANLLRITGAPEQLEAFREFAIGPDENDLELNNFIPVRLSGEKDWLDSCVEHWGTKWGCYHVEIRKFDGNTLVYRFHTAWNPFNDEVLEAMSSRFPTLKFKLKYGEMGMAFYGAVHAEHGKIVDSYHGRYESSEEYHELELDREIASLLGYSG